MAHQFLLRLSVISLSFICCLEAKCDIPTLAPHRAVYKLSLSAGAGLKAPLQAHGRIFFEFSGSECEGYVQNFRQVTEILPFEGAAKLSDTRTAFFEESYGRGYRFKSETKIDYQSIEKLDGFVEKRDNNFLIHLKNSKQSRIILDRSVIFPTEHLRRILQWAMRGETLLEAMVYDGNGQGDKATHTLSVIGKVIATPSTEKSVQIQAFKTMNRWPVTISYFDSIKRDGQPIYVLSLELYENGVSRALRLDYGDFVLSGELIELLIQPEVNCKAHINR